MDTHSEPTFANYVRQARSAAGLSQEQLAERAGISVRGISDIERGLIRAPQQETLRLLAEALDLPSDERRRWEAARRQLARRGDKAPQRAVTRAQQSRAQLPTPLTSFVGREQEVAEAVALLTQPDVRLVTLTGPGGVGKTRLALAVGEALAERYRDGIGFVNLAPLDDPDLVVSTIAAALGIHVPGQQTDLAALIAALRDARQLLLLDNLEQVIAAAPALTSLLIACPGLTLLATSRAPLRVQGEHEYAVEPLALPDVTSVVDPEHLRLCEAVDLFEQRARAVVAQFKITDQNAQAIVSICRRLDGLPLAIELAASRIRLLPPPTLLARLERRLPLLTDGPHDIPARQRTLHNTIAWSYDLLEPEEQRLFRALSIFRGGWTLEAAEAVLEHSAGQTGNIDVLDGHGTLVEHNLIRLRAQPDGESRFTMLETIAEFARERLDASGEAWTLFERHAQYFLELAEHAGASIIGVDQARWMALLEQEHANLRAVLLWAHEAAERGDAAAIVTNFRLVSALFWFWHVQGHWREVRDRTEAVMELLRAQQPATEASAQATDQNVAWTSMYAKTLLLLGSASTWLVDDRDEPAWRMMQESLDLFRQLGQHTDTATALMYLGYGEQRFGNFAEADRLLQESIALCRQLGDSRGVALGLQGLGVSGLRRADYAGGETLITESLALFTSLGDERSIAASRATLGALRLRQGDLGQAHEMLKESLLTYHDIGDMGGIAWCLEWLAELALVDAAPPIRPSRAARLLGAAARLRASISSPIDPIDRPEHERIIAAVQARLSDPAFVAAWETGRAMTLDEAVTYALEADTEPEPASPTDAATGLTPRELEVLRMVADGRSDKEIASSLSISPHTVMRHVQNVLTKLDLSSRTAAATWAVRRGLV
jgi:predicted ATPase/DNA-binding CsgD family transcriptional regulator/transcriptional regulator with XRE-family HTH domain